MVLLWQVHYKCDELGRVIEYRVENLDGITPLFIALRKKIEYDKEGRVFRVKAYNNSNRLLTVNTYEYPNERQIRRIYWYDKKRRIPLIEFFNLTSSSLDV